MIPKTWIRILAGLAGAVWLTGCSVAPTGVLVSSDAYHVGGSLFVEPFDDGTEMLVLDGPIDAETSYAFQALVERSDVNALVITQSSGGDLAAAHQIGSLVHRERMDTAVFAACYSACVDIFIAGRDRLIARDAELMLHAASDPVEGYKIDDPYWRRLGFGALNDRVYRMKSNEIWLIEADRAVRMRIATDYLD